MHCSRLSPFELNCDRLLGSHFHGLDAVAVPVAEEQDALALALCALAGLDPLAPAGAAPQAADEAPGTALDVGAVVTAHDGLDGLGGLVGVVKGNGADEMVEDVGLDDAVEDVGANGPEVAVNGGGGTSGKGPALGRVVGKRGIGVLEEGDCDCVLISLRNRLRRLKIAYRASG